MTLTIQNKISVTALDRRFKRNANKAKKIVVGILGILKKEKVSVDIYLAGEALMKKLNSELRNKEYSADILSFEEPEGFVSPERGKNKLGEIFLNWPRIARKGKMAEEETKKLLIHGVLHLLGYGHGKDKEAEKMERKEKEIMEKIK
jgi:probable rRNA maturation factor